MAEPFVITRKAFKSLTPEEAKAWAESIGFPELINEDGSLDVDMAVSSVSNGVTDCFKYTDKYAAAMRKLFKN